MNEIIVGAEDVTGAGRDNPGRHRSTESERIADGKNPLADPRRLVGHRRNRKISPAIDLEQCEVCLRIGANQLRGIGLAVVGRDFDLFAVLNQMIGRHRISIRRYEKARPLIGGAMTPRRARIASRQIGRICRWAAAERPLRLVGVLPYLGAYAHDARLDAVHKIFKPHR